MIRRPPRSTRTDTLVPYTTLVRSLNGAGPVRGGRGSSPARPAPVLQMMNVDAFDLLATAVLLLNERGHVEHANAAAEDLFGRSRKQLRGRSEEHTSELQSLMRISYAVFCLKKKNTKDKQNKSSKNA